MARFPIFSASELGGKSVKYSAITRKNVFTELKREGDRSQISFYGTAGLSLFTNLGANPVRGMLPVDNTLYVVQSGTFYSIDNTGTATSQGSLIATDLSGRVDMAYDGTYVVIVSGTTGYTYNIGTDTFAEISDADFPDSNTCCHDSGYIIGDDPGTGRFYIDNLRDPTNWTSTDFANAEGFPDDLVRVFSDHGEIVLFGALSTEFWANNGSADFPYSRIQGSTIEWGLAARWSVAKAGDSLAFLAKNPQGEVRVVLLTGYQPKVISSEEVTWAINEYSTVSDASAISYSYAGHSFYQINFPTEGKSWLYDVSSNSWSQLTSGSTEGRHRAEMGVPFLNKIIVADYSNGKLYRMDLDTYLDDGATIIREMVSRHIFGEDKIKIEQIWLDMETGVGTASGDGSTPQIMLQISRDGGYDYGDERWVSVGAIGERLQRAVWRRNGMGHDIVLKFRYSEPTKFAVFGAWLLSG